MKVVNSYIFRAVCALSVGILLVSNPERMTGLLVQVIGGLFLVSGLVSLVSYVLVSRSGVNQMWNMFRLRRVIPYRWYVWVAALAVTVLGVFVLFKPMASASLPFILLGATFMLYGIAELVNGVRWRKYDRMRERAEEGGGPERIA